MVLEVDPYTSRVQQHISIRRLTDMIVIENDNFHLFGVIEYDTHHRHFKTHVLRKNDKWIPYDGLQLSETQNEESFLDNKGIAPYLLFY